MEQNATNGKYVSIIDYEIFGGVLAAHFCILFYSPLFTFFGCCLLCYLLSLVLRVFFCVLSEVFREA